MASLAQIEWIQFIDHAEKVSKILAIAVGGIFAYYKFFRGRIFSSRLEASFTAELLSGSGDEYLKVVATMKNLGLSRISFKSEFCCLDVFSGKAALPEKQISSVHWERLGTFRMPKPIAWIEPSEPPQQIWLIALQQTHGRPIYKVTFTVLGTSDTWSFDAIVLRNPLLLSLAQSPTTQSNDADHKLSASP